MEPDDDPIDDKPAGEPFSDENEPKPADEPNAADQ